MGKKEKIKSWAAVDCLFSFRKGHETPSKTNTAVLLVLQNRTWDKGSRSTPNEDQKATGGAMTCRYGLGVTKVEKELFYGDGGLELENNAEKRTCLLPGCRLVT